MRQYRYFLRLDTHSYITCPLAYDPFQFLFAPRCQHEPGAFGRKCFCQRFTNAR